MSSPLQLIHFTVQFGQGLSSGQPGGCQVWEYRLAGCLEDDPAVPCYRFSRVLPE